MLIDQGRQDEALEELQGELEPMRNVVAHQPDSTDYRRTLARTYGTLSLLNENTEYRRLGCELIESAVHDAPQSESAQELLGEFWLSGLFDSEASGTGEIRTNSTPEAAIEKAIAIFQGLYERRPGKLRYGLSLSRAYQSQAERLQASGDSSAAAAALDRAEKVLQELLEIEPNYNVARRALERCQVTRRCSEGE